MKQSKWISHKELRANWMKDPKYKASYDALETEFQIARQIIDARIKQNVSQKELALRIGTGQAVISRLEGMNAKPSISLLKRVARALDITFHLTIK